MNDADLRRFAWQGPLDPCTTCQSTPRHACRTSSGANCPPHKPRLDQARGWVARQTEIDDLQHGLDTADATITELTNGIQTLRAQVTQLTTDLQAANLELTGRADHITTLERDLTATKSELKAKNDQLDNALHDLDAATDQNGVLTDQIRDTQRQLFVAEDELAKARARIAELEAGEPEPTRRTFFGACPDKTGSSNKGLADQRRVIAKWGKGAAVRMFFGGIGDIAPRDPDAGIVHASWKEFNKANLTDAKVKAAVGNLLPGDVVEVGHESDNDNLTGTALAARIDIKNTFHDVVKKVRPDLLVANTVTGWALDPKSKTDLTQWVGQVKADVLGADCDGIRPTQLPYTNYDDETKTTLALIEKYAALGYKYGAAPEFGCPRIPAADPDGSIRAAYHDKYADLWEASGKWLYACLYEYNSSPEYALTTPAEIAGWRKHTTKETP